MRIDHLNCAVMNPPTMAGIPAHVFVCHTDDGLVLVDSGVGTRDHADPGRHIGPIRHLLRPELEHRSTALAQLAAVGHDPGDVTHIVLTHLDWDHAGGLADFPDAVVHTTADEHDAAFAVLGRRDRLRYRDAQFEHQPVFRTHAGRGDRWRFGLTGHEVLPGITLVPMPGHTRGHAVVAVEVGAPAILVHAGDAAFDASSYTDAAPSGQRLKTVPGLRAFEKFVAHDRAAVRENHRTLARLSSEPDVTVVPAHDRRITSDLVTGQGA